jgi:hypothetical protein
VASFGQVGLGQIGSRTVEVSADGRPLAKPGGISIDWSTVAAVSGADVTLNDGTLIPIGFKYQRYGQTVCRITANGKFGPYDPAAADGRQLLVKGDCFWLNRTVLESDPASDHGGVACYGGLVFLLRLLNTGVGAHTLAGGPTLAELYTAFPLIQPVLETPTT